MLRYYILWTGSVQIYILVLSHAHTVHTVSLSLRWIRAIGDIMAKSAFSSALPEAVCERLSHQEKPTHKLIPWPIYNNVFLKWPPQSSQCNIRPKDMANEKSLIHFLKEGNEETVLIKHQSSKYTEGGKQKWQHSSYNKSFLHNRPQLHCLYSTLGNRELLTWPSYVHDPLWHAGKKPHRHFMTSGPMGLKWNFKISVK